MDVGSGIALASVMGTVACGILKMVPQKCDGDEKYTKKETLDREYVRKEVFDLEMKHLQASIDDMKGTVKDIYNILRSKE